MTPTCVLFDLDGTLIDHFQAIHRCHAFAMRQLGLPEPTYAVVHAAVGGGLDEAIAKIAGQKNVAALLPHFLAHWKDTHLDDVILLPGAMEILQTLARAGIPSAVLTNKRGYAAREVCDHLKITPLLKAVIGVGDSPWLKPDPAFTQFALEKIGATAAGTVLVGDSPFDVATAKNSGLAFLGVTTGTHNAEELKSAGAEHICAGLADVAQALGL